MLHLLQFFITLTRMKVELFCTFLLVLFVVSHSFSVCSYCYKHFITSFVLCVSSNCWSQFCIVRLFQLLVRINWIHQAKTCLSCFFCYSLLHLESFFPVLFLLVLKTNRIYIFFFVVLGKFLPPHSYPVLFLLVLQTMFESTFSSILHLFQFLSKLDWTSNE